jgi:hypothetical protein
VREEAVVPLPETVMLGLVGQDNRPRRLLVINDRPTLSEASGGTNDGIVWQARAGIRIVRQHGLLLDSARLQQGQWAVSLLGGERPDPTADVIVAGSLRGGRYSSYFRPLLEFAGSDESAAAVSV